MKILGKLIKKKKLVIFSNGKVSINQSKWRQASTTVIQLFFFYWKFRGSFNKFMWLRLCLPCTIRQSLREDSSLAGNFATFRRGKSICWNLQTIILVVLVYVRDPFLDSTLFLEAFFSVHAGTIKVAGLFYRCSFLF